MKENRWVESRYPYGIKVIQQYVIRACDQMDYPGGPVYDLYPDDLLVETVCRRICSQMMEEQGMEALAGLCGVPYTEEESITVQGLFGPPPGPRPPYGPPGPPPGPRPPYGPPGPPPGPRPPYGPPGPPPGPRPPYGPPGPPPRPRPPQGPSGPGWLGNWVKVLLLNEMAHRRK